MSFWQTFSEIFRRTAQRYQAPFLSDYRVDVDYDPKPIKAGEAYCRLWLVEMHLARDVDWFQQRYPVVHAAIRFNYDNQTVTIPYIAKPGYLEELTTENLDKVIQCNYPLTPLFPYNGGLVQLQAGLFSMQASDPIGKFIKTMGRFSELLPVPELSSVVKLAEPIYQGIEDLISAGNGQLELGYQQTFAEADSGGDNDLKAGYFAAILAQENQINSDNLCVVNDSLKIGSSGKTKAFIKDNKTLQGYSYMLFRLEKRSNQYWNSLTKIKELVNKAEDAVIKREYDLVKNTLLPAIKLAIYRSADIAILDRQPMFLKVKAYLKEISLQGAELARLSLSAIMQRPLPEVDAQMQGELSLLEKLFEQ